MERNLALIYTLPCCHSQLGKPIQSKHLTAQWRLAEGRWDGMDGASDQILGMVAVVGMG
jgi:hypothetical protein